MSILPVSALDEFDAAMLEEATQSILIFEDMAFTNTGNRSIVVFPAQGSIVFDGQQYETLGILGDTIGEVADGATVTADIWFELPITAEDAAAVGEVRLRVDAPSDSETFDSVGENIDLVATWG
ncbi:MAG: hypothetical protein GEU79_09050 [Acidimicrobiia bacterium]|nr:hypothetical protein [Acidimicrobiia bacterium]